jgi:hypothetical protein
MNARLGPMPDRLPNGDNGAEAIEGGSTDPVT